MKKVKRYTQLALAGVWVLLSGTVAAQTFNDQVSKDIFGDPKYQTPVLEQPRSQPLPEYTVPKPKNHYEQAGGSSGKDETSLTDYLNSLDKQGATVQQETPSVQQQTLSSSSIRSEPIRVDPSQLNRFRNSPCWLSLGYDPDESYEVQDARYRSCEEARGSKRNKRLITYFLAIVLIPTAIGVIVYYGRKKPAT